MERSPNFPNIHPGEGLWEDVIKPRNLTIGQAAEMMGISRPMLSNIIHGKASITASMALRIATVFGGNAGIWLRLQMDYDLRKAEAEFAKNPPKLESIV